MRLYFPNGWYQTFMLNLNDDLESFTINYPRSSQLKSIISDVEIDNCVRTIHMNDLNRLYNRDKLKNRLPIKAYNMESLEDIDYFHRVLYFERQYHRLLFRCGLCDLFYFDQHNREWNAEYDKTHPKFFTESRQIKDKHQCFKFRNEYHYVDPHRCYFPHGYPLVDENGKLYYDAKINGTECDACDALGMFGRCMQFTDVQKIYDTRLYCQYEKLMNTMYNSIGDKKYWHPLTPNCLVLIDPILNFESKFESFHLMDGIKFYEYCDNGNWLNFDLANNQNMIIRENIEIIRGIGGDVGPFAFFMEKDYNLILYMKSEELNRFCIWDIEFDGFNLFVKKLDSEIVNYIPSI